MKTKPFNIEEAKNYPARVYTRSGRKVRIISFSDTFHSGFPIYAEIIGVGNYFFTKDGWFDRISNRKLDEHDLVLLCIEEKIVISLEEEYSFGDLLLIDNIPYSIVGNFHDDGKPYYIVKHKEMKEFHIIRKKGEWWKIVI